MNTLQHSNIINSNIIYPIINNDLPSVCLDTARIIKNNESKQYNCINSLINSLIFDKNFIKFQKKEINPFEKNFIFNFNLFNNINNTNNFFNSNSTIGTINNDNSNIKNNLNFNINLFNNRNNNETPIISRVFKKNNNPNINYNFLNSKIIPVFHKLNNKDDIIINNYDEKTFNSEILDKDNTRNSTEKKVIFKFKTNLKKKRGRVRKSEDNTKYKRVHTSTDFDNLQRKIQVHYLTFIVNFINEILYNFYPYEKKLRFLNISYEQKKNVSFNHINDLKNKKIGEILKLPPSPKYKIKSDNNINEINFNKICETNIFLKNFFEKNYLDFFNEYYIKDNKTISFCDKVINFSKISFFSDLLKVNQLAANKMQEIIKNHYAIKTNNFFIVNKK